MSTHLARLDAGFTRMLGVALLCTMALSRCYCGAGGPPRPWLAPAPAAPELRNVTGLQGPQDPLDPQELHDQFPDTQRP